MGRRVRAVAAVAVVLAVGTLLGSAVARWTASGPVPPGTGPSGPAAFFVPEERVRVEVLNGGGVDGMASEATDYLREIGFDVVDFGNAGTFDRDSSVVYDRVGRLEWARAVADAMEIGAVMSRPDSNLYVDVTVVLGARWRPPADSAGPPPGVGTVPAWWDLRRFFRSEGTDSVPVGSESNGRMLDPADERNRE